MTRQDFRFRDVPEQVDLLRRFFPGLELVDGRLAEQPCPPLAEGWCAIPHWRAVGDSYHAAVQRAFDALSELHGDGFCNRREGEIHPGFLRMGESASLAFDSLQASQSGSSILVTPVQSGRTATRSTSQGRPILKPGEFGLGVFGTACMLLTHPDRLVSENDPFIDCQDDECRNGSGGYEHCPFFAFFEGQLMFGPYWYGLGRKNMSCGSAIGFFS